jgi:D-3-phosphoglycerate dehydrogenase
MQRDGGDQQRIGTQAPAAGTSDARTQPVVALLGARHPDLDIERGILGPVGAHLVSGPGGDADAIVDVAGGADVIIAGSGPRFDAAVLARLRCSRIVRAGVGVDTIDLVAARAHNIGVAYVPDYGTEAVAQHTLALVLAATRRLTVADRTVRSGGWGLDALRPIHLPGALTAGVIGHGRIGARVAQLLRAVGFGRVLAHDPHAPPDAPGVDPSDLDTLLRTADVVTLHVPGTDGTPLVDALRLSAMRPGSVLVNTARGSLVEAPALAAALRPRRTGGRGAGRPRHRAA